MGGLLAAEHIWTAVVIAGATAALVAAARLRPGPWTLPAARALAGTIQAIISPDLAQHFPSFPFIQYYVAHGGVVAAALFLVVGLGQWPRRRAVIWVAALTIVYAAVVGLLDAVTGADYLYLRAKPASATLLDLLGPWPWYIGWAALIGIALFLILGSPFLISRKGSADRITGRVPR